MRQDAQTAEEGLVSPTKGILLTPGAAAAKKKNVSFGVHVVDNEVKAAAKPPQHGDDDRLSRHARDRSNSPDKSKGRTKLIEALEQVRDDTKKRKLNTVGRVKNIEEEEQLPDDLTDPQSESGKYWKREYDIYRANTQREVKKLITKQRAAKGFAKTKDTQCTELADQLKHEYKRAQTLEKATKELTAQITDLKEELLASQDSEKRYLDEIAALKHRLDRRDSAGPDSGDRLGHTAHSRAHSGPEIDRKATTLSERLSQLRAHAPKGTTQEGATVAAQHAFSSNNGIINGLASEVPLKGRSMASIAATAPLQTLSVNTTSNERKPKQVDVLQPAYDKEIPQSTTEKSSKLRSISLYQPTALPDTARPALQPAREPSKPTYTDQKHIDESPTDFSASIPVKVDGRAISPVQSTPSGPRAAPDPKTFPLNTAKENVSPDPKPGPSIGEPAVKPSVLWSSINAPQNAKRGTSMLGKDGKEVDLARIEAARARINARGRVMS